MSKSVQACRCPQSCRYQKRPFSMFSVVLLSRVPLLSHLLHIQHVFSCVIITCAVVITFVTHSSCFQLCYYHVCRCYHICYTFIMFSVVLLSRVPLLSHLLHIHHVFSCVIITCAVVITFVTHSACFQLCYYHVCRCYHICYTFIMFSVVLLSRVPLLSHVVTHSSCFCAHMLQHYVTHSINRACHSGGHYWHLHLGSLFSSALWLSHFVVIDWDNGLVQNSHITSTNVIVRLVPRTNFGEMWTKIQNAMAAILSVFKQSLHSLFSVS